MNSPTARNPPPMPCPTRTPTSLRKSHCFRHHLKSRRRREEAPTGCSFRKYLSLVTSVPTRRSCFFAQPVRQRLVESPTPRFSSTPKNANTPASPGAHKSDPTPAHTIAIAAHTIFTLSASSAVVIWSVLKSTSQISSGNSTTRSATPCTTTNSSSTNSAAPAGCISPGENRAVNASSRRTCFAFARMRRPRSPIARTPPAPQNPVAPPRPRTTPLPPATAAPPLSVPRPNRRAPAKPIAKKCDARCQPEPPTAARPLRFPDFGLWTLGFGQEP